MPSLGRFRGRALTKRPANLWGSGLGMRTSLNNGFMDALFRGDAGMGCVGTAPYHNTEGGRRECTGSRSVTRQDPGCATRLDFPPREPARRRPHYARSTSALKLMHDGQYLVYRRSWRHGMIRSPDIAGTVIIMIGSDALHLSFAVTSRLSSSTSAYSRWGGG